MIPNHRVIELARAGVRGRNWYAQARRQIATVCQRNQWEPDTFAAILAVTSPRIAVRRNIRVTYQYMLGDEWTTGIVKSVRTSVATWERTGQIKGPKTSAFYRCLTGCNKSIVLDSWMAVAFNEDKGRVNQVAIGRRIKTQVRRTARVLGWTNAQTQAAIWTAIMTESGRNDQPFCIEEIDREFLPF